MDLKLELFLGVLQNISHVCGFLAVVTAIASIISIIIYICTKASAADTRCSEHEQCVAVAPTVRNVMLGLIMMFFSTLTLSMVPTTDQMFHIRLNLIKFQLASPENVQKGSEEILSVAKKLECKYLGCPEEKKKEEKKEE